MALVAYVCSCTRGGLLYIFNGLVKIGQQHTHNYGSSPVLFFVSRLYGPIGVVASGESAPDLHGSEGASRAADECSTRDDALQVHHHLNSRGPLTKPIARPQCLKRMDLFCAFAGTPRRHAHGRRKLKGFLHREKSARIFSHP